MACPALLDRSMATIHDKPQSLCEYAGVGAMEKLLKP